MSNVTGKTSLIIGVSSGIDFSVAGRLASLEDAISRGVGKDDRKFDEIF